MPPLVSAFLGAGFFLSELSLAIRRRVTAASGGVDRDRGSLRILWIVITLSISLGSFLAARGVRPWLPPWLIWSGVGVFVAGAALRWWSIRHLGRFFTVNVTVADDHRLVDTGPYRFVRHPSYAGLLLQFAGLGLSLGTLPSLLVVVIPSALAVFHRIGIEEAALQTHLAGAYAAYCVRTKKIVPLVY